MPTNENGSQGVGQAMGNPFALTSVAYTVVPVTSFLVCRDHSTNGGGGHESKGQFESERVAYEVAYALCKEEHRRLGWSIGDERIRYPDAPGQASALPASRIADSVDEPALTLAETQQVVEGKTAPRVTEASIKAKIATIEYFRSRHLTICVITMHSGFFVIGESAPAAPENYDQQVGERYAYENAFQKLWPLEGYLLREHLHQSEPADRAHDELGRVA